MTTHTPRYIILIVVGTLALLSTMCVGTLAWLVLSGQQTTPEVLREFSSTSAILVTALVTLLANTRSGPAEPSKTETTTQITEKVSTPKDPE